MEKKRGICKFFSQTGSCRKGDACEFEHVHGGGGSGSTNWRGSRGGYRSNPRGHGHGPRNSGNYYGPSNQPSFVPRSQNPGAPGFNPRHGEDIKYCRGFHRGECTEIRHGETHAFPPGVERKSTVDMSLTDKNEQIISIFSISETEFAVCSSYGNISIWNSSLKPTNTLKLNIFCTAIAYMNAPSCTLLVCGSYFQDAPLPKQYGLYVTDGNNSLKFPV